MISDPVNARAVASWLHGESAARRLDPIVEVYALHEWVELTVTPAAANVWATWCNLLRVDTASVHCTGERMTACGWWDGVEVHLTGLEAGRWSQ